MGRYLSRRLFFSGIVLWIVGSLLFVSLKYFPGAPFSEENQLSEVVRAKLEMEFGYGEPFFTAYINFWKKILLMNWGPSSMAIDKSVVALIGESSTVTIYMALSSFVFSVFIGFILGIIPSCLTLLNSRRYQFFANLTRVSITSLLSLPLLFLAPLMLWIVCFELELFPIRYDGSGWSLVFPILLLSVRHVLILAQSLDQSLSKTLLQDHVRTMQAIGVAPFRLIYRWSLRSSIIIFLVQLPGMLSALFTGSLFVEFLFSIHGLGFLMLQSLQSRDWMVMTALVFIGAVVLILAQFVTDICTKILDPRVNVL